MPYKYLVAAAVSAVFLAGGCAAPRIDGRDEESTRASIRRVRSSLPQARQDQFDMALTEVMSHGGEVLPLVRDRAVRHRIDGLTGAEVLATAESIRKQKAQQRHEQQLQSELADIRQTFERIHSKEGSITLTSDPETERLDAGSRSSQVDPLATSTDPSLRLASETPLTNDPQILAWCGRYDSEQTFSRRQCEQSEMDAREKLERGLPSGIPVETATKVRIDCGERAPSFVMRAACEADEARMLRFIIAAPALLDRLPPDKRAELEPLLRRN